MEGFPSAGRVRRSAKLRRSPERLHTGRWICARFPGGAAPIPARLDLARAAPDACINNQIGV
jgi:hypothetical protein